MPMYPEICGVLRAPVAIETDNPKGYGALLHGIPAGERVRIVIDPAYGSFVTPQDAEDLADLMHQIANPDHG